MERLTVLWTDQAQDQLKTIYHKISRYSHAKAMQAVKRILSTEMQLGLFPESGVKQSAVRPHFPYKFIISGDYKIVYHTDDKLVYIDTVYPIRLDPEF